MNYYKLLISFFTLFAILNFNGCGGSSSSTATLSVLLTDEPGDYRAVYVTIDEVLVQKSGSDDWIVVARPHKTYDLLTLKNGITEELGKTDIPVGIYTQMRLVIGSQNDNGINILNEQHPFANYVIFTGDDIAELYIPSDTIKTHNFEVIEENSIIMTINFDADKSIHYQASVARWALTPVISIKTQLEK